MGKIVLLLIGVLFALVVTKNVQLRREVKTLTTARNFITDNLLEDWGVQHVG